MGREHEVVVLERAALERWCNGDPSGFLDINATDVAYFDPFRPRRIDGIEALRTLYEGLRGTIRAPRFELINPRVQEIGDAAVLTFNFVSWAADGTPSRWNCTEVYRRQPEGWRIVQSHWSFTEAGLPAR